MKDLESMTYQHLKYLCETINSRRVGSEGNRLATDYAANKLKEAGFHVETPQFACIDWLGQGASLTIGDKIFLVQPSPYSLGCQLGARLSVIHTLEQLETTPITGDIVLLMDDIAKEQIMPKNFEFYNPEEHQRIIQILETKQPAAIIAGTTFNPEVAGALYPYPLFEDGDFDIPSVFTTDKEGQKIAEFAGMKAFLDSRCQRMSSHACNVIGHINPKAPRRIVLSAHIDAKPGTPGALDNASGVVTLLILADMLKDYRGNIGIEILLFNGEDYYNSIGEIQYLHQAKDRFPEILLNINLDLLGFIDGKTAYSFYELPEHLSKLVGQSFSNQDHLMPGEPWYQGDHMVFVMNQVPALALVGEKMEQNLRELVHTPEDTLDKVDPHKLVEIASSLDYLIREIARTRE